MNKNTSQFFVLTSLIMYLCTLFWLIGMKSCAVEHSNFLR